MSVVTDVQDWLEGKNLSSPTGAKWNTVKEVLAAALGITPGEIYATYIGSSGNLSVRLTKQIQSTEHYKFVVAFLGYESPNLLHAANHLEQAFSTFPSIEAGVLWTEIAGPGAGNWAPVWCSYTDGTPLLEEITTWAANIKLKALTTAKPPTGNGVDASGKLTAAHLKSTCTERGILVADEVLAQIVASLRSGKHIVLTGPPGTAKTTLAEIVAQIAVESGDAQGYVLTTATADWTTFETIGGFRPKEGGVLEFEEGHFLRAIRANHWLIIDELNRSHFDRAFGQLFTVLSGQPVVLPYSRAGHDGNPLVVLPQGKDSPVQPADELIVPEVWRIVATMNVFDKDLLFEMSYALMRRFAFIEVPAPEIAEFEDLIEAAASQERAADLVKRLLDLRALVDLGPAIFQDAARYLSSRLEEAESTDGRLLFETFYSYFLPQFEGIGAQEGDELFRLLTDAINDTTIEWELIRTLKGVLGLRVNQSSNAHTTNSSPSEEAKLEPNG